MVMAEATYFVARRLGPQAESAFLAGVARFEIEGPAPGDWERMAELVAEYADFPLGGTDASVVALAERLDAAIVLTLDTRHFAAVVPRHRPAFELLPA
jgi:predicted nucleic acid-binding protein